MSKLFVDEIQPKTTGGVITGIPFMKRTVIEGAVGTVDLTASYQTVKTYSFTPQAATVSMLVYFKSTVSHRAGGVHWHRVKYDGDTLMITTTTDNAVNGKFGSVDQELMMSTITIPKSGTLNFIYECCGTSSPTVGMGNKTTLTIVELGV